MFEKHSSTSSQDLKPPKCEEKAFPDCEHCFKEEKANAMGRVKHYGDYTQLPVKSKVRRL